MWPQAFLNVHQNGKSTPEKLTLNSKDNIYDALIVSPGPAESEA